MGNTGSVMETEDEICPEEQAGNVYVICDIEFDSCELVCIEHQSFGRGFRLHPPAFLTLVDSIIVRL